MRLVPAALPTLTPPKPFSPAAPSALQSTSNAHPTPEGNPQRAMGNSVSHCKSAEPGGSAGVRVKEALGGESTQLQGADASDDATSPADTAPAVPVTPKEPAPHGAFWGCLG